MVGNDEMAAITYPAVAPNKEHCEEKEEEEKAKGQSTFKSAVEGKSAVKGLDAAVTGSEDPGPALDELKAISAFYFLLASAADLDATAVRVQQHT